MLSTLLYAVHAASSLLRLRLWDVPQFPSLVSVHDLNHQQFMHAPSGATKSIAIVGAGSGGLAALKTILDVASDINANWEVVLYEQHRDVGGLWLADAPGPEPDPPELPESPVYPLLITNTANPTMTYPHVPFPPGTSLFPSWKAVLQYHEDFAKRFDLTPHIRLNHTVVSTQWHGHDDFGDWHVEVHSPSPDADSGEEVVLKRTFDHLVVATGHNHYPHIPTWNGTDDWLANSRAGSPKRQIVHSIYYRHPKDYANQSVVLVGTGASGRDIALQVGPLARVVYQSVRENKTTTPGADVIEKPEIAYFTSDTIVFIDGTVVEEVDTVILATGYEFRIPFLTAPHASTLVTNPNTRETSTTAQYPVTNLRYIFPLYRHIFSLAPAVPPTALTFIGLPVLIANCPSDYAQGMFIAHAFANESLLPPREEMLAELVAREEALRAQGFDPYFVGHRLQNDNEAQTYQDDLVEYLKKHGALPDDGQKYVEQWRRMGRQEGPLIYRGWQRVRSLGEEDEWLRNVRTEDEWADLLRRLAEWQRKKWEEDGHQPVSAAVFPDEYDL
ncbi:FAD/NAD-P-binding domain-containing protein [Laetiporus sulphureus 93-53]|uniref:FAD/NAD-P-binding domain-containing protein n=1 Tax=Laetiporus sulphureus 93-53 TaxID=1314785 RepID=A0A165DAV0_9APHY|nr:FAD/NAD-P-binding domain-containing protein [Laetiporus sulphureus 93-53]KZT04453.1 FAD/NAD-P-binding domain-containing protein [Laetiporus sulphureus 93-53]